MTHFGTSAKFIDALAKAGLEPARDAPTWRALRTMLSTGSPLAPEGFDYVYAQREEGPAACRRSAAARTSWPASPAARRSCPVWRGELQCRDARHEGGGVERRGQAARAARRASSSARRPSRRCRSASGTTPTARKYRAAYFEKYRERLAPRRLERGHAARRHGDLRPLGRRAQSRRRAHRHRRDLPPGRAPRRGGGVDRHRPGLAGRRARRALRAAARGARARRGAREEDQGHDPQQHHAAPRAGGDRAGGRHPAHQVATRSWSSPCAPSSTASR